MYNERKEGFSLRDVLIQFLFVALFVFILIWIFPMKTDLKKVANKDDLSSVDMNVDTLVDRIFNENILMMKDAAKDYYTLTRLPQKVGDKKKMTLGEMLEQNIILPFADKDGKKCDENDSYVEVTKLDDEYLMKVNLKCSKVENYLLVHMGCYDYCSTTICETNKDDVKTPDIKPVNPKPEPKVCAIKSCPTGQTLVNPNSPDCYCKAVEVPKTCPIKTCPTGETLVNPNSPDCYCKAVEVPKTCPIKTCPTGETLVNPDSPDCYCKKVEEPAKKYKYEYQKEIKTITHVPAKYSNWSSWSSDTRYTEKDNISFGCTDTRCNEKLPDKFEKVGVYAKEYDKTKPIYQDYLTVIGHYNQKTCDGYDYFKVSSTNTTYAYAGETYVGLQKFASAPKDNAQYRYEFYEFDYKSCAYGCQGAPTMVFKVYKRNYVTNVSNAGNSIDVKCSKYTTKSIPIYGYHKRFIGYEVKWADAYQYVHYYRYKTRTLIKEAYDDVKVTVDTKYSTSANDKALLNAGYVYIRAIEI